MLNLLRSQLIAFPLKSLGEVNVTNLCKIFSQPSANLLKLYGSHSRVLINTYKIEKKQFSTSLAKFQESEAVVENEEKPQRKIDPLKDRTKVIAPETSIRYLKSKAYKTTYGDEPVWVKYRRNFKGVFIPRKTRETCIISGEIRTGSPCPVCRDEYLVLHYTNIELLKQFISPYTGEILSTRKIHLCQKRLLELEVAVKKAKDLGLLTFQIPFRKYDYSLYYPHWKQ